MDFGARRSPLGPKNLHLCSGDTWLPLLDWASGLRLRFRPRLGLCSWTGLTAAGLTEDHVVLRPDPGEESSIATCGSGSGAWRRGSRASQDHLGHDAEQEVIVSPPHLQQQRGLGQHGLLQLARVRQGAPVDFDDDVAILDAAPAKGQTRGHMCGLKRLGHAQTHTRCIDNGVAVLTTLQHRALQRNQGFISFDLAASVETGRAFSFPRGGLRLCPGWGP